VHVERISREGGTPLGVAENGPPALLIYGVGGVLLPFAGIKAIDVVLVAAGLG
jgi:high-affinity K+ transport system ATPase subunit B